MNTDPYAAGVLDPEIHRRLVPNLERFARDANITPEWIWTPLGETCGPVEVGWVKRFRFHRGDKASGLVYVGWSPDPPVEDRMAAIAGVLIRNFINPRVMTVHELFNAANDGAVPDISCLLVPDFFLGKAQGGDMPSWRVPLLLSALLQRHALGVQTVLHVSDPVAMGIEYGVALKRHIESHYVQVEV